MTRYQVNHPCLYVVVGYDDTIHSLFALVKDMDVPDSISDGVCKSHEEILLELGNREGEVPNVEALVEALNPYLDVPETVAVELKRDIEGVEKLERIVMSIKSSFKRLTSLLH